MKYVPVVLMILSFLIVCFGVYLRSENNALGLPVIIGGLIGEAIFIMLNRMMFNKGRRPE
jgi:lipopolysaccharide export LptBFGC system permease protein LptF